MPAQQTASRFQTTSWTLIARAKTGRADLEELLRRYWSPVYASLRRHGHGPDDAADITQAFLSDVVLKRDMIGKASSEKGRFRSYLLTALRRFEIDHHRSEHGRDGKRVRTFLPDDPETLRFAEPIAEDDPSRAFDRQWATTILEETLAQMEETCKAEGMIAHWRVFDARILGPSLRGSEPTSIDALVGIVEARNAVEISSMLHSAKRKFRSILRGVIAETIEDPADVDHELAELREFLEV